MIKLLIFDAGDLLWKNSLEDLERNMNDFFKKYKIDGNLIARRWNKIKPKVETGKIKYSEAVEIEFRGLGMSKKSLKEWTRIHLELELIRKRLNPYVRQTLKVLKKIYKIAILSDEVRNHECKLRACKRLGINVFDEVFLFL